MLNYLWAAMIGIGILYGAFTGNIEAVGNAAVDSATEAVKMCITMVGVLGMWMGFINVARVAGLIALAEKKLEPIVNWMFPNMPKGHPAREHILTNIIANVLGLGWAATPAGLKAMAELENHPIQQIGLESDGDKVRKRRGKRCFVPSHIATDEMCTFLVINIYSLQLIPVNMIAYRSQYGSANPTAIVLPAIIATTMSTLAGVIWCRMKCGRR